MVIPSIHRALHSNALQGMDLFTMYPASDTDWVLTKWIQCYKAYLNPRPENYY